ncbi:hypothetical protein Pelo_8125 [Pelomyxa schiedti]|nr:hypothetical protein Pelo_12181 [Pelomyxa schiedti]KAH3760049.1 hypothetical protein Pelo_8125 [Pelomyxa schiedti]
MVCWQHSLKLRAAPSLIPKSGTRDQKEQRAHNPDFPEGGQAHNVFVIRLLLMSNRAPGRQLMRFDHPHNSNAPDACTDAFTSSVTWCLAARDQFVALVMCSHARCGRRSPARILTPSALRDLANDWIMNRHASFGFSLLLQNPVGAPHQPPPPPPPPPYNTTSSNANNEADYDNTNDSTLHCVSFTTSCTGGVVEPMGTVCRNGRIVGWADTDTALVLVSGPRSLDLVPVLGRLSGAPSRGSASTLEASESVGRTQTFACNRKWVVYDESPERLAIWQVDRPGKPPVEIPLTKFVLLHLEQTLLKFTRSMENGQNVTILASASDSACTSASNNSNRVVGTDDELTFVMYCVDRTYMILIDVATTYATKDLVTLYELEHPSDFHSTDFLLTSGCELMALISEGTEEFVLHNVFTGKKILIPGNPSNAFTLGDSQYATRSWADVGVHRIYSVDDPQTCMFTVPAPCLVYSKDLIIIRKGAHKWEILDATSGTILIQTSLDLSGINHQAF